MEKISKDAFYQMASIGETGLHHSYGHINEDPVPKLQDLTTRMTTYKEMLTDPIVGAIMLAIEMHLRRAKWEFVNAEDEKDSETEFLDRALEEMEHTFQDFLSEALSMLPFGFSIHELVYKKASDGKILWKKFSPRSQDSIIRWKINDEGELEGVYQRLKNQQEVFIPWKKMLLFRPNSTKNNPEGKSALRTAYRPYYFKKRLETIEAIGLERDLSGYPVLHVPIDLFSESELATAQRNYAEKLVTRVRKDEQMGAVLPPGWELELLAPQTSAKLDIGEVINRYNLQIAQSLLSDIIMLGHFRAGSYALSEKKYELFVISLDSWLDSIAQVINKYAIPRLLDLNGMKHENIGEYPRIKHTPVSKIDEQKLANVLFRLMNVSAVQPDEKLEKYLRDFLGLPTRDPESTRLPEDSKTRLEGDRTDDETRPADSRGEFQQ